MSIVIVHRQSVSSLNGNEFFILIHAVTPFLSRFCVARTRSGSQIALVCFDEAMMEESISRRWKNMLICSVSIISAFFLIATLAVYVILPELRELQDKAMMAAVTTLAVSYTVLSIQHLRPHIEDDYAICVSLGT